MPLDSSEPGPARQTPSDTTSGYPDACIHELYERQVDRTPDRLAVFDDYQRLTYQELNSAANSLARYLYGRGIRAESVVALSVEQPMDAIITVLAILKAGGAYFGLPKGLPNSRLREMMAVAAPQVLITDSPTTARTFSSSQGTITLSEVRGDVASEPSTNLEVGVHPDNAALIRFTSGSTGEPKGVVNLHRSLTSRLSSLLPDITEDDICGLNSSLGFGSRLFYPLCLGARVALTTEIDVNRLASAIERMHITSVYMVPTLLRYLLGLNRESLARLESLRAVTVGGEVLSPDVIARFQERLPRAILINIYGGNEIGTTATLRVMTGAPTHKFRSIGRPVANTRVYILDSDMQPVPVGVKGELYVASAHLARGYLNNPCLTAESFLPDPFGKQPGCRLYKTGDIGRYFADGEIEYLGRVDNQVKIGGHRVELEEIEQHLIAHDVVKDAVVIAEEREHHIRLKAYIVLRPGERFDQIDLRTYLTSRLPPYMVPAIFTELEQLPLTPTGKVDRRAISTLSFAEAQERNSDQLGPAERTLHSIWSAVLGLGGAGANDRFLDLGGDSLAATSIILELQNRLGVDVPLDFFFGNPTFEELSSEIAGVRNGIEGDAKSSADH